MTSSGPELNTVFVVPPRGTSSVPTPLTLYPNSQPQVCLYPGYQNQAVLPNGSRSRAEKVWKEGKVLGAIQILIGLLHIGFGGVLATTISRGYIAISVIGGYPFWGGISFITSGSLSVSAQKRPVTQCKMNGSVGMNIVSAIFSAVGIIIFLTELGIYWGNYLYYDYNNHYPNYYPNYYYSAVPTGKGISSMLLIFSILEFVITCISSHFGCQIVCLQNNQVPIAATVTPVPMVFPPQGASPPLYSNVVNNNPPQGGRK